MDTKLYECKIKNKKAVEMKTHGIVLREIKKLEETAIKKLKNADGVGYLPVIYEEMGNTYLCQKDMNNFLKYCEKAISLRNNEMGKYNTNNAICMCHMAKHLIYTEKFESASAYLSKSFEIFSHYATNHPYFWVHFSARGYYW